MESIRKQNQQPPSAGSVPGWPLQGPFSRSPEARKVAPWVQACLRSFTLSNLRHVVYRDAVKKAYACSVFRRVAAMVELNLVPWLSHSSNPLKSTLRVYCFWRSSQPRRQAPGFTTFDKWRIAALYEMRTHPNPPRMRLRPANVKSRRITANGQIPAL